MDSTATSYGPDGPGFEFRQVEENFSFPKLFKPALGPIQPSSQLNGYNGSVPGIKRPGCKIDKICQCRG